MSFICPDCGFRDDVRWRNTYFDPHTSIMNWSDFQLIYPALAKLILEGHKAVSDSKGYIYERQPLRKSLPIRYIKRGTFEEFKARGLTLHLRSNYTDSGERKNKWMNPFHSTTLREK